MSTLRAMDRRLGVLAFGDSITNGGGELQWGVALQSWALWIARGLGVPYTGCAIDGATAAQVAREQIPRFLAQTAAPDARYDVGALYAGVNDVRRSDWEPHAYERDLRVALDFLGERCDRRLVCTIPRDLGRPRAGARVDEANAAIERVAARSDALLVDLRDFGARNLVMADHVHPTAFGQVAIAERALAVLAADGMTVRARPSALIAPSRPNGLRRLQGDAAYAYRHAKVSARATALIARERLRSLGTPP
jgi:lysophospholipase L1-like esterase